MNKKSVELNGITGVLIERKMKNKIECAYQYEGGACSVRFNDLQDTFWFDDKAKLQEFLNIQERERYYDKQLRKGYFDYENENKDVIRYAVDCNRGTLKVTEEKILKNEQV